VLSPITLSTELAIDKNLTIQGPGAAALTISGNNSVRVFNIGSVTPAIDVTLSGLTLTNGKAPLVEGQTIGGCIFNNSTETLTIKSVTVSNSTAQGGIGLGGGGILHNTTGTVDIINSTISGNSSIEGFGGGITNNVTGTVNITNSTISGNSAGDGIGGAYLGAGTLNVTGSTISSNTGRVGGGLCLLNTGTSNVVNSTISGNTALIVGGGVFVDTGSTLTLTNSTISNNNAGAEPGGVFVNVAAKANIKNTIVALNTGVNAGRGPDVDGLFTSLGHNLIGKGDGSSFINGVNGDQVGTDASPLDPKLGPLQNNDGPTQTLALLAGSPAIDAGDDSVLGPPLTLTTDQRGPGFLRKVGMHVDIGAFEVQFDTCLKDNNTGNLLQWNSTTGQYKFTRCSDSFMLTGTGTVGLVNGIRTLMDFKSDRRISAGLNVGQLTGHATVYLQVVQGVWQSSQIVDTNPNAVCACSG
jgi:hypothetical protein